MDIIGLSCVFGDHVESNSDLLRKLARTCPAAVVDEVERLLDRSGAVQRRLRRPGQAPLDYLSRSFAALDCDPSRIEVVINTSITRGVIEPAQAALFCEHLDLPRAQAFDVTEACNGLVRGLQLAFALLSSGQVRGDILLISHEFFDGPRSPTRASDTCASVAELTTLFAGMTFGAASCCVLVRASENRSWSFRWGADNTVASSCTMALPSYREHVPLRAYHVEGPARIGEWQFCSNHKVLGRTFGPFEEAIASDPIHMQRILRADPLFVHSHSKLFWDRLLQPLGASDRLFHLYPDCGNLGTASLPAALALRYGGPPPPGSAINFLAPAGGFSGCIVYFEQG